MILQDPLRAYVRMSRTASAPIHNASRRIMTEQRINVRGVVFDDDGNVFAVKHRDRHDGSESTYWATPGGGLDSGESLHDGLTREFVEEIGVTPKIGRVLFIQQFVAYHRDGRTTEKIELFFHVTNTEDFRKDIDLSKTTHGHELARAAFVPTIGNFILPSFLQDMNVKEFINTNQPVFYINNLNEPSQ